jgi:hypothetical protein
VLPLEALDRDVKKPDERPALIAEYQTLLPDKKLHQTKLHDFYQTGAAFHLWTARFRPNKPGHLTC